MRPGKSVCVRFDRIAGKIRIDERKEFTKGSMSKVFGRIV